MCTAAHVWELMQRQAASMPPAQSPCSCWWALGRSTCLFWALHQGENHPDACSASPVFPPTPHAPLPPTCCALSPGAFHLPDPVPPILCQPYCQGLGRRVRSSKSWGRASCRKPGHSCSSPISLPGIAAPWESYRTVRDTPHGNQADAGSIDSGNCAASFARRSDMVAGFAEVPRQEKQKGQPGEEEVQVTKSKWDSLTNAFCSSYNHLQQWKARPEIVWFASTGSAGFDTHQSSLVPSHHTLQRASILRHRAGVFLWSSHDLGTLCGQVPDQGSKED